ncbi:FRG domain-containing protein [Thalassotalea montiporae]
MPETIEIKSLSNFIDQVEIIKGEIESLGNHSDLLFRGQRQDRPLRPKLARLNLNGEIRKVEKLMLDEFKRASLPLAEFEPINNWDWLALAQHHGLPTRLLDWTYSALIALWFAVQKEPIEDRHGVVWVLKPEISDFRNTEKIEDPLSNKLTKIFRSRVVSKRISAQAGAFTVHRINSDGQMIRLENNTKFKNKLSKFIVPAEHFASIRKSLKMMGVNHSTVFPDIDGLCQHLERRFSKLKDEE